MEITSLEVCKEKSFPQSSSLLVSILLTEIKMMPLVEWSSFQPVYHPFLNLILYQPWEDKQYGPYFIDEGTGIEQPFASKWLRLVAFCLFAFISVQLYHKATSLLSRLTSSCLIRSSCISQAISRVTFFSLSQFSHTGVQFCATIS